MYVVLADPTDEFSQPSAIAATLEQAFAWIVCRCGYAHHFETRAEGWALHLIDVERPGCSPDPILSALKKGEDAKRELLAQAVDGRLKGLVALPRAKFERYRSQFAASE